jgi:hypothetical protein
MRTRPDAVTSSVTHGRLGLCGRWDRVTLRLHASTIRQWPLVVNELFQADQARFSFCPRWIQSRTTPATLEMTAAVYNNNPNPGETSTSFGAPEKTTS